MDNARLDELREIGERNKVTLTLVRNWCSHAEIVSHGSGGLFQAFTGLPIAMCQMRCKHERAPGAISMHLKENAMDFHDRNCFDCDKRDPVALPNLSDLVGERDRSRAHQKELAAREVSAEHDALAARVAARATVLFDSPTATQKSLVGLLDRLDREPSSITGREFVESVRAVTHVINDLFRCSIAAVVEAGGEERVTAGLIALELTAYDSKPLASLALRALARSEAMEVAADIAGRHLGDSHREEIKAAAPLLLLLSEAPLGSMFDRFNASHPEALLAAHRAAPDAIHTAIERALSNEGKLWRRAACFAINTLLDADTPINTAGFARALVESFRQPDDPYLDGPAGDTAAWVLAALLRRFPDVVEGILARYMEDGDDRVRLGILQAYMDVFRSRDSAASMPPAVVAEPIEAKAFERIVQILSTLPDDERLQMGISFLRARHLHRVPWRLAAASASVLLGTAALACQRAEEVARGSAIISDPRPLQIRALDSEGRAMSLSTLARESVAYVAWLACEHPEELERAKLAHLFLETLRPLPRHADRLRSMLVEELGELCGDRTHQPRVLPEIYSAMTHGAVGVRAAASRAYADLCGTISPESLPSLLHESFLILLGDPYVAVHQTALHSLRWISLPDSNRRAVVQGVGRLVNAYRGEAGQGFFVATALSVLLACSVGEPQLYGALLPYAVEQARTLPQDAAYSFLRDSAHHLRTSPGYGDLLLDLPITGEFGDYQSEFVLDELSRLSKSEVQRVAPRIVEIGAAMARRHSLAVLPLLALLNEHGEWGAASRLVEAAVKASGSEQARLPERLRIQIYQKALELETSLEQQRSDDVERLAGEIRVLESNIAEDEQLNRNRRDRHVFS